MSITAEKKPLSIKDLSADDLANLQREFDQKQKQEEQRKRDARNCYKELVNDTVLRVYPMLESLSREIARVKELAYGEMQTLIKMKAELFSRTQDQYSHTFSNQDGSISITVGHRIVDRWDDTVNTGIAMVEEFLQSLSQNKDKNTQRLVGIIHGLLSRNAQGNLKTERVMDLESAAKDFDSPLLNEAIMILKESYKPYRTKQFVTCKYRDQSGTEFILPLSITEADLPTETTTA